MRNVVPGLVLICSALHAAHAQPVAGTPSDNTVQLDAIAVTGTQPGPGLWKVSKGDHVLWILGTTSPLPRNIRWKPQELQNRIAESQEVMAREQIRISANTGFFGTLALLPSLIGVRNNPDHARLVDVVPPDLYAQWVVLKRKYIGHSNRVEKWRPIFAALKLYEAALDKNRLTGADYVDKEFLKTAKRAHVSVTTPKLELKIDQPRAAIKQFKAGSMNDIDCFRKTLERIDVDVATMTARANAWATGDIEALRKLPQSDQMQACMAAISELGILRERGLTDVDERAQKVWLDAAQDALKRNTSTVAVESMRRLLAKDGFLARLKALGYTIDAPDGDEDNIDVGEISNSGAGERSPVLRPKSTRHQ
ncbi:MAG: TraB/GumN family protein [Rudaea sp.]